MSDTSALVADFLECSGGWSVFPQGPTFPEPTRDVAAGWPACTGPASGGHPVGVMPKCGVGALEGAAGLMWADTPLKDEAEGIARLQAAWRRTDNRHYRPRHDYRTAAAVDAATPGWYDQVDRARCYGTARRAMEEAARACTKPRARRLAEREAIFRTLEDFGLVSRTRGGQPIPRSGQATIS